MEGFAVAAVFATLLWWGATGAILWLDGLPRATFRWSLLGATLLLGVGFAGMVVSAADPSPTGAYLGFTCGLLAWGWLETAFLLGWIVGPNRAPCPPGVAGWARFRAATLTLIHHELAAIGLLAAAAALTWEQPNRIAFWTLLLLWAMRMSTKFNLYLGVPNLQERFLPEHLRHLATYFRRRAMNPLFPLSVTVTTLLTGWLVHGALAPGGTGAALLATLSALALLEHWFLVLPLNVEALWRWAFRARADHPPSNVTLRPGVAKEAT